MKKVLIILLVLSFTTNAQALIFKNCYNATYIALPLQEGELEAYFEKTDSSKKKMFDEKRIEAYSKYKGKYEKKYFNKKNYEAYEYRLLKEAKGIRLTIVHTESHLSKLDERRKQSKLPRDLSFPKIMEENLEILKVTENYIEAVNLTFPSRPDYYRFNLTNGTYLKSEDKFLRRDIFFWHCQLSGLKRKSNYLDYWWAVILIIAITFFIFTQSGKRLKKIRRK